MVDGWVPLYVHVVLQVHYGYASLNPVSRIPAFCVLPKAHLDVRQCSSWVAQQLTDAQGQVYSSSCGATAQHSSCAVVCCDQSYMHLLPQLREAMLLAYQVRTQGDRVKTSLLEGQPRSRSRSTCQCKS